MENNVMSQCSKRTAALCVNIIHSPHFSNLDSSFWSKHDLLKMIFSLKL